MAETGEKLGVYIPQEKQGDRPLQRLAKLAKQRDRSLNYLVVQAILEYLQREERKK